MSDVATPLSEGPIGFLFANLLIAAAIPVSMIAVAVGFLRPPTWLLSVVLRIRWRWLAVCSAWLVGWALVATGIWFVLDGLPGTGGEQAVLLIALCLLTTPLQAAGEEFLVRGWLTQSIGAWFARPVVGAVVAGLLSATVFALLHGTQNAWLFGDRFAFGLIASYLVWRTGGLEAAIALHSISNISAIIPAALEGTLDESLTLTEAPVGTVLIDVVMLLVAGVVVVVLARRRNIERQGPPQATPAGPGRRPNPFAHVDLGGLAADRYHHSVGSQPLGAGTPVGYGVIGSTTDSGSVSLGSSPGTPARCVLIGTRHGPVV